MLLRIHLYQLCWALYGLSHSIEVHMAFYPSFYLTGLMYWCIFNLFEFARKTFAPSEERQGVESYSSLFGIAGAVILSISQALVAAMIAGYLVGSKWPAFMPGVILQSVAGGYFESVNAM